MRHVTLDLRFLGLGRLLNRFRAWPSMSVRNRNNWGLKIIWMIALLALVGGACAPTSEPSVTSETTTTTSPIVGAVLVPDFEHEIPDLSDGLPVPFSYLLREAETAYAAEVGKLFWMALGNAHANFDYPSDPTQWSVATQKIRWPGPAGVTAGWGNMSVIFGGFTFDPTGDFNYGKTTIHADPTKEFSGAGYVIDLSASDDGLHFERSESVTLTRERSTSTTSTIEMDVQVKAGVKGTVGGDAQGAKLETDLETTWGVSDTEEKAQAESESKSQTTTVTISEDLAPRKVWLITVNTTTANTSTPFNFHAAMQWDQIHVSWQYSIGTKDGKSWFYFGRVGDLVQQIDHPDNQGVTSTRYGAYVGGDTCPGPWSCYLYVVDMVFDGLDDMAAKLSGKSVDWPGTLNHSIAPDLQAQLEKVYDKASRYISVSGVQMRNADGVVDIKVSDVSGQDINKVIKEHGIDEDHVVTGS